MGGIYYTVKEFMCSCIALMHDFYAIRNINKIFFRNGLVNKFSSNFKPAYIFFFTSKQLLMEGKGTEKLKVKKIQA